MSVRCPQSASGTRRSGAGAIDWPSTVRLVTLVPEKLSSPVLADACVRATTAPTVTSPPNSDTTRRSARAWAFTRVAQERPATLSARTMEPSSGYANATGDAACVAAPSTSPATIGSWLGRSTFTPYADAEVVG